MEYVEGDIIRNKGESERYSKLIRTSTVLPAGESFNVDNNDILINCGGPITNILWTQCGGYLLVSCNRKERPLHTLGERSTGLNSIVIYGLLKEDPYLGIGMGTSPEELFLQPQEMCLRYGLVRRYAIIHEKDTVRDMRWLPYTDIDSSSPKYIHGVLAVVFADGSVEVLVVPHSDIILGEVGSALPTITLKPLVVISEKYNAMSCDWITGTNRLAVGCQTTRIKVFEIRKKPDFVVDMETRGGEDVPFREIDYVGKPVDTEDHTALYSETETPFHHCEVFSLLGNPFRLRQVRCCPFEEFQFVIAVGEDNDVRFFDLREATAPFGRRRTRSGWNYAVEWPQSSSIYGGGEFGDVFIVQHTKCPPLAKSPLRDRIGVKCISATGSPPRALSVSTDGFVSLNESIRTGTRKMINNYEILDHFSAVRSDKENGDSVLLLARIPPSFSLTQPEKESKNGGKECSPFKTFDKCYQAREQNVYMLPASKPHSPTDPESPSRQCALVSCSCNKSKEFSHWIAYGGYGQLLRVREVAHPSRQ